MNPASINRLLAPRSLALFGSTWADAVAAGAMKIGYSGELWRVHPSRKSTDDVRYFRSVEELPDTPDASFIGVPAAEVPRIAAALAQRGAGGFVCFAAGFSETGTEEGRRLTRALEAASADLPFFGPNCYGFLNFFDKAALWPDQVVGQSLERGVAIICQSGTLGLNLLFNRRSLPIGFLLTVGNQTRLAVEDMIELLSADARVSAFGLYLEGMKDPRRFAAAVECAHKAGKPIAIVKAGRTETAARTAHTHTGSLAGADRVFDSFCAQAGLARCETLASLCETLKVFHAGGPLRGRRVVIMGASGGDMAMAADSARDLGLTFPAFPADSSAKLREILTDRVTIANPFDFHTHIWFDPAAMQAMFSVVHGAGFDATGFVIDCPPAREADPAAYISGIDAFLSAFPGAPARAALMCSLAESMSRETRERCFAAGVVPLQGQREALEALDAAGKVGEAWARGSRVELQIPHASGSSAGRLDPDKISDRQAGGDARDQSRQVRSLSELESKQALHAFGVSIPRSEVVTPRHVTEAAQRVGYPIVLKATGAHLEHKSDVGAVIVNIRTPTEAEAAASRLAALSDRLLVEQMVVDGVAEILVGVTVDPQFGQVIVLGAGGVLTELLRDSIALLPPYTASQIESGLQRLQIWRLLCGYRGKPAGDVQALVTAVLACGRYAHTHLNRLEELDINPVIVRPAGLGAVAVDALIRLSEEP